MGAYFIPLTKILPFPRLEKLPFVGMLYEQYAQSVGVRGVREDWNDDNVVYSGELVIDGEIGLNLAILRLFIGDSSGAQSTVRFEVATDRSSLLHVLVQQGEEESWASTTSIGRRRRTARGCS